jgi:hypothetical protein
MGFGRLLPAYCHDYSGIERIDPGIRIGDFAVVLPVPFALSKVQGRAPPRRATMKVTPTDHPACGLSSWLWVLRMRADTSAVCAINRHLRMDGIVCSCALSATLAS